MDKLVVVLVLGILVLGFSGCELFVGKGMLNEILRSLERSVYVSIDGDDGNSGLDPGNPVRSINRGIQIALDNNISLIKVSTGVYTPGNGLENGFNGVKLINIYRDRFIIEGGYGRDFSSVIGYSELDGNGSLYHIIFISNSVNVGIRNFVIRGGNANGSSFPDDVGGGVLVIVSSGITLTNVVILNNSAAYGGGIFFAGSENNTLSGSVLNNSANNNGGGIFLWSSHANVIQGEVSYNYANYGGGIYLYAVTNISFTSLTNKANTNYGIFTNNNCSGITGLDSIMWGTGALNNVPDNVNQ